MVDDHLIAIGLAAGTLESLSLPASLGDSGEFDGPVATTCSWWWRLCSALSGTRGGALSRHFSDIAPLQRAALIRTVQSLPERLVVLDLRDLIPAMAVLSADYRLNQLSAEVVVVAEVLGAAIVVGQDTPAVRETARERGLAYRVL